jgi:DNA-binding MarR family transcriptional regulator
VDSVAGSYSHLQPNLAVRLEEADYRALAGFRFQIRRFLHFSEAQAHSEGLEPQQHQFLLAVRAFSGANGPTIKELAEQLLIRHHSAVGLADRLTDRGMVQRQRGGNDRRQVQIRLTPLGESALMRLSNAHLDELLHSGPRLIEALTTLLRQSRQDLEDNVSKTQDSNP